MRVRAKDDDLLQDLRTWKAGHGREYTIWQRHRKDPTQNAKVGKLMCLKYISDVVQGVVSQRLIVKHKELK